MNESSVSIVKKAVVFGHSHITPLQFAYHHWKEAGGQMDIHFIQLLDERFRFAADPAKQQSIPSLLAEEVKSANPSFPILFTCFSGNEHQAYSMLKHPRPYDFVLPNEPHLPLEENFEILPYPAIYRLMISIVSAPLVTLAAIGREVPHQIVCLSTPPPIPDNTFLSDKKNALWTQIEQFGISSPVVRYKLWYLHALCTAESCRKLGMSFMFPPPAAQDEHGFMKRDGWHPDGVHGNMWYGERVLDQIEAYAKVLG